MERALIEECWRRAAGPERQPSRPSFVVVTDPAKREALAAIRRAWNRYLDEGVTGGAPRRGRSRPGATCSGASGRSAQYLADHLAEVPVHVVACHPGRTEGQRARSSQGVGVGLGASPPSGASCWPPERAGWGPPGRRSTSFYEEAAAEVLGIPYDEVSQMALIPLAHSITAPTSSQVRASIWTGSPAGTAGRAVPPRRRKRRRVRRRRPGAPWPPRASAVICRATTPVPGGAARAVAAAPVPTRVPQPVSLAVAGRICVLRAGQGRVPAAARIFAPVGWSPEERPRARRAAPPGSPRLAASPSGATRRPRRSPRALGQGRLVADRRWIAARRGRSLVLARVGGDATRVAGVPPGARPVAAWSPDSQRVVFAAPGGAPALGLASVEGGASRIRLRPVPARAPGLVAGGRPDLRPRWRAPRSSRRPGSSAPRRARRPHGRPTGGASPTSRRGERRVGVVDAAGSRPALMAGCGCDIPLGPVGGLVVRGDRLIRVSGRATLVSSRPDGGDAVTVVRIRDRAATRVMWVPRPT